MAGTAAWIDVLPNLSAFGTKLNSGVTAAATSAGRNAGKKFSDAMNQAAGRDVLSEQVKSLQQAEKKAAQAVSQCTSGRRSQTAGNHRQKRTILLTGHQRPSTTQRRKEQGEAEDRSRHIG